MAVSLNELHRAIGRVVYEWAHLESEVKNLACYLAGLNFGKMDGDAIRVALMMTANIEIRPTITIAIALAAGATDEKRFYGRVVKTLNPIAHGLHDKRNRYVHDRWVVWGDKIGRFQPGSTAVREPGPGAPEVTHGKMTEYVDIADVEAVADEIAKYRDEVIRLQAEAQDIARRTKQPPPLSR